MAVIRDNTTTTNTLKINSNGSIPVEKNDGTAVSGATIPSGGLGIIGWLSAIWQTISSVSTATNQTNGQAKNQLVDTYGNSVSTLGTGASIGLVTAEGPTFFYFSTNNSSTTQLSVGQKFTGVTETALSQQALSVLLTCDQPGILRINSYINPDGSARVSQWIFHLDANENFNRAFTFNSNYVNVEFENTGNATTTTFNLNTAYGTLPAVDPDGHVPVGLEPQFHPLADSGAGVIENANTNKIISAFESRRAFMELVNTDASATIYLNPVGPAWDGTKLVGIPILPGKSWRYDIAVPNSNINVASSVAGASYFFLEG